ncbi:hypothetical protein Fleli_0496 [Bernardetia litoralis DSM 6794]|uniref:Uncharacterized protein n=1 Tax=Bernardetia litoralis (strain ATCC 23117 / DSM 6794 / NBRC 15988 / NCIMB 1366 / Fx l1 / Sio-4) TaxID=880071 RepID=I4AG86_BERLS|nr:hypothetical protein Fleli_0496 [Bernardetia litoralis DSM 6794]
MLLPLDIIFYTIYKIVSSIDNTMSKILLNILDNKHVKKSYGKNIELATKIASPNFENTIDYSNRAMGLVLFVIELSIVNIFLVLCSFNSNYIAVSLYIIIAFFHFHLQKLYSHRYKSVIEKFDKYTAINKILLFLVSFILCISFCVLAVYNIIAMLEMI